jgi:hypothetical protein
MHSGYCCTNVICSGRSLKQYALGLRVTEVEIKTGTGSVGDWRRRKGEDEGQVLKDGPRALVTLSLQPCLASPTAHILSLEREESVGCLDRFLLSSNLTSTKER